MTIHTGSIAQKRSLFAALPSDASAAARRLGAEQRSAHEHTDPNLSPAGLAAEVRRRAEAVQQQAATVAAEQRALAADARAYLDRVLEQERPRITDYNRAQAGWTQALMYLDNGHTLRHVLANADLPLTLAVEEFGPHWLRSQRDPATVWELRYNGGAPDPINARAGELQNAVLERLATVAEDPDLGDLIRASLEADASHAAAKPWWQQLDAIAAGRTFDGLRAAAEARLADHIKATPLTGTAR